MMSRLCKSCMHYDGCRKWCEVDEDFIRHHDGIKECGCYERRGNGC